MKSSTYYFHMKTKILAADFQICVSVPLKIHYHNVTIKIILKSANRPSFLFGFKDVIPKELRSHIVYKFSCGKCIFTYYGKSEHHVNIRSSEHIGI